MVAQQQPIHLSIVNPSAPDRCPSPLIDVRTSIKEKETAPAAVPTKKRVRFSDQICTVQPTIHINDYTVDEYLHTWYNLRDFDDIKRDNLNTIRRVGSSCLWFDGDDVENEVCMRGLESRTGGGFKKRHDNKAATVAAVLEEQDRHRARGIVCGETIAKESRRVSDLCRNEAHAAALKDQIEALWITAEDYDGDDQQQEKLKAVKVSIKNTMKLRRRVIAEGRRIPRSEATVLFGTIFC